MSLRIREQNIPLLRFLFLQGQGCAQLTYAEWRIAMTEPIKWRDARKVKPKVGQVVLVKPIKGRVTEGWWSNEHLRENWFVSFPFRWTGRAKITHWAPMPKGPKR
jgi:hypothetical protein